MTMLATVVRPDFVLSVADRCGSLISGNDVHVQDTKLNKHLTFALTEFTGSITYTGYSKWCGIDGKLIITDKLIADTIADCAIEGWNLGSIMARIAFTLNHQADLLARWHGATGPFFTLHLVGFTNAFAEPMIGLITDSDPIPSWKEEGIQRELASVGRFRIYVAIRGKPCVLWGGNTHFLSVADRNKMDVIITKPSAAPYDIAKFAVNCIRKSSKHTKTIGNRVSAIIMPQIGAMDTGFWQDRNDRELGAMPLMVFQNGKQIDPTEFELDLTSFVPGTLDRHNISYRSLIQGRIPKRMLRRLNRMKRPTRTPTISELIMFALFGRHWDDPT